jgi:hypothetical protein
MKYKIMITVLALLGCLGAWVLAAPRDTPEQPGAYCVVRAGATIEPGHMVVLLGGLAYPASDEETNTVVAIGRAETGAVSNELLHAKPGIYRWDAAGEITEAAVGQNACAMSSTSVALTAVATNDNVVGKIVRVDPHGVWVQTSL